MDVEVRKMVDEAYQRTLALVTERKEQIRIVAEFLLEKETITNADITKLIGAREFGSKEYEQYVEAGSGWEAMRREAEQRGRDVGEPDHAVASVSMESPSAPLSKKAIDVDLKDISKESGESKNVGRRDEDSGPAAAGGAV